MNGSTVGSYTCTWQCIWSGPPTITSNDMMLYRKTQQKRKEEKKKQKKKGNHFQTTRVSSHRKYKVPFYLLVGKFFFMLLLPFRCLKSFFGYISRSNIYSTFIRSLFALAVIVKNLNAFRYGSIYTQKNTFAFSFIFVWFGVGYLLSPAAIRRWRKSTETVDMCFGCWCWTGLTLKKE